MRVPSRSSPQRSVLLVLLAVLLAATASCAGAPFGQATATQAAFAATGSVQDQLAQLAAGAKSQATATVSSGTAGAGVLQAGQAATPSATATRTSRPTAGAVVKATRTPRPTRTPSDGLPTIALAKLPQEARRTIQLIQQGGPFPYARDGVTFENREGRLPRHVSGYYKEYTVVTPGSSDRGARRIIAGAEGELYYTDDHYDTFKRVILP